MSTFCRDDHDHFFPKARLVSEPISTDLEQSSKLVEVERQLILKAIQRYKGNKTLAARYLGIGRATLSRKLRHK